jgi:hypothetical protein
MASDGPGGISDAVLNFVSQIDGLHATLPLAMTVIQAAARTAHRSYQAFVDQNCQTKQEGGDSFVHVDIDHEHRYAALKRRAKRTQTANQIVPRSFLVSLVSQYDAFLGSLVRAILSSRHEMLKASGLMLSFSQLSEFNSIADARSYILEKEVENLLRKSHAEQFDWMEEKFGVKLREGLPVWPAFVEVTERRNLFVHSDGVTSSQYFKVCRENKVVVEGGLGVGSRLNVTPAYFETAYRAVFEIGVKLAHVLWRKTHSADLAAADRNLADITYDVLRGEEYELAITLLEFATTTLKKHCTEEYRRIFLVNLAQAQKWTGNSDKAAEIMSGEDWTAVSDKFRIAKAVLADDFEGAVKLMEKIGAQGDVPKAGYRDWPLFKEFRKSAAFQETFLKIFGEPALKVESLEKGGTDPAQEAAKTKPTVQ